MFTNLHTLPPDKAMFTLYVSLPDQPYLEEYDQVAPARAPENRHLAALVIEAAKDPLVELYGDTVEVRIITNQSTGEAVFTSGQRGFRPVPVVLSPRMLESFEHPYDALLNLCQDEHDGMGGAEYLDALLGQNGGEIVHVCPACGEPIDYCQGHGEIGDPEGRAILDAETES